MKNKFKVITFFFLNEQFISEQSIQLISLLISLVHNCNLLHFTIIV